MVWQPRRNWVLLSVGNGRADGGVWSTPEGFVAKRLVPGEERPSHYAYWRRQADVAASGLLELTVGLRAPRCVKVDSDPDGITLWTDAAQPTPLTSSDAAAALGRFALNRLEPADWFARRILRDRLADDQQHGGWAALETAEVLPADVRRSGHQLWSHRSEVMSELDRLPQLLVHGDAHPPNLLRTDGDDVIAVDWDQFGVGALGFDLGYLLQFTPTPIADLVAAYQAGSAATWPADLVRRGAVLVAAVTLVARAAWALDQPDPGVHLERLIDLSAVVDEAVSQASWNAR
ncbi:aminoglycoside phosphotransferase family protein [Kribbella soli]|uniref:Aminoglycoside phosphotransferase family protein n=1 Tax=Kribbella soli TaxID=1124743 RepID=A0A4R0H4J2_9ACTN|nr:aminoglycoside phosphotransferase family protein [Kribbella soli]